MKKLLTILSLFLTAFSTLSVMPPGWQQLTLPLPDEVTDIYFTDTLNGWITVLGDNSPVDTGYVLYTTNGGANWAIQLGHAGNFTNVRFFGKDTGYAFGNEGFTRFYKTTNGGSNWQDLSGGVPLYFSDDMQFINKDTGWLCSEIGGLAKTTNGGINWAQQLAGSFTPKKVFFVNADTGWVLGTMNNLYRTTNGGNNWNVQFHSNTQLVNVLFINSTTGFLTGFFGFNSHTIKRTTNGGNNWDSTFNSKGGIDICFVNTLTGFACGNLSTLQKTTNGGINWYNQTVPSSDYSSLFFLDTFHGFAGGTKLLKTTDGGGPVLSVQQLSNEVPNGFKLYQNYPNPFNPRTIINYQCSPQGQAMSNNVKLTVYDISGRVMQTLVDEKQQAGTYQYTFDGSGLSSGVYFYTLQTENFIETKKMILTK